MYVYILYRNNIHGPATNMADGGTADTRCYFNVLCTRSAPEALVKLFEWHGLIWRWPIRNVQGEGGGKPSKLSPCVSFSVYVGKSVIDADFAGKTKTVHVEEALLVFPLLYVWAIGQRGVITFETMCFLAFFAINLSAEDSASVALCFWWQYCYRWSESTQTGVFDNFNCSRFAQSAEPKKKWLNWRVNYGRCFRNLDGHYNHRRHLGGIRGQLHPQRIFFGGGQYYHFAPLEIYRF